MDSDGNQIIGLVIQQFGGDGVQITGDGNQLYGNYIGTTANGLEPSANTGSGIYIENAVGNQIGDAGYIRRQTRDVEAKNVISGNLDSGINITGQPSDLDTESFDQATDAVANGWTEFGNRVDRNDYGFSATNQTGPVGESGFEAGGTFVRGSTVLGETSAIPINYYADTSFGDAFTLDDALHAEGQLTIADADDWNNNVFAAHFGREDAEANLRHNVLGMAVVEPDSRLGSDGIRIAAYILLESGPEIIGNWINAPVGLDFGVPYTWRYDFDPEGGVSGAGQLTVEAFADGVSLGTSRINLSPAQRDVGIQLNAFGLKTGGYPPRSHSPNSVNVYFDELRYSRPLGNTIQGNFIGTTADGIQSLGNGQIGGDQDSRFG